MKNIKVETIFVFLFSTILLSAFSQNTKDNNEFLNQSKEKANQRLIKPGTHILSFYASNNQYPLILQGPSALLQQETSKGFNQFRHSLIDALYINYQYSLKNNFFVEGGFKYIKFYTSFMTNEWIVKSGLRYEHTSSFSTLSFNFGSGYRFIGDNNLRFFDVHAGFSLGITDNPVGRGGYYISSQFYLDGNDNIGTMSYAYEYRISSRYYLGFYLGLSKDIRITKNLYATARYHYQFGKNSRLTEHTLYYDLPTLGINNSVRASNTAKGQMYALGLRWFFDKK